MLKQIAGFNISVRDSDVDEGVANSVLSGREGNENSYRAGRALD